MNLPDEYTYRAASNADIPKIKELIFQTLEEFALIPNDPTLDQDLDDIDENYQNGFFGLLENPDKKIIATFALFQLNESTAEIRKMYLLPAYRSKGLGKWMVHFLIEKAKNTGYKKLELQTASVLQSAIAMYRKTGFEEVTSSNASPRCDRAFEMQL